MEAVMFSEQYEAVPLEEASGQVALEPLYQVVLFDDDDHTYPYVVEMISRLFNFSQQEAFEIAYQVDYIGQAVVTVCPFDEARDGVQKIRNYGPDPTVPDCTESMKATVLPAEE